MISEEYGGRFRTCIGDLGYLFVCVYHRDTDQTAFFSVPINWLVYNLNRGVRPYRTCRRNKSKGDILYKSIVSGSTLAATYHSTGTMLCL